MNRLISDKIGCFMSIFSNLIRSKLHIVIRLKGRMHDFIRQMLQHVAISMKVLKVKIKNNSHVELNICIILSDKPRIPFNLV